MVDGLENPGQIGQYSLDKVFVDSLDYTFLMLYNFGASIFIYYFSIFIYLHIQ